METFSLKDYYIKMLGIDSIKNLEDLSHLKIKREEEEIEKNKIKNDCDYGKCTYDSVPGNKSNGLTLCKCNNCPYCKDRIQHEEIIENLNKEIESQKNSNGCGCKNCQCNICPVCGENSPLKNKNNKEKFIEYREIKSLHPELPSLHICSCSCDKCSLSKEKCAFSVQKLENEYLNDTLKRLRKKENPALLPPNSDLLNFYSGNNSSYVCCFHHSMIPFNAQEKNPRNYQGMPPCLLKGVAAAGKPTRLMEPLNLFQ